MLPDPSQDILRKMADAIIRLDSRLKNIEALPLPRTVIKIATLELESSQASIEFTSIPDKYTHLDLIGNLRTDVVATSDQLYVQINGDTGANYDWIYSSVSSTAASASDGFGDTKMDFGVIEGGSAPADYFSPVTVQIPNYSNADHFKSFIISRACIQARAGGSAATGAAGAFWRSTNAITSIKLYPGAGSNFVDGSIMTLYGRA